MPEPGPQHEAILAALERLLAWSEIVRSPQLGRFLDYIVRRTLAGDGGTIKAYSIAVDVLGRPADFDPQADPIVRVQARRLRSLLDEYYSGAGAAETTRILLPVGRYVPEFVTGDVGPAAEIARPPVSVGGPKPALLLAWLALALFTIALALGAFWTASWAPLQQGVAGAPGAVARPSITVVEFQNLAGNGEDAPAVSGLAIELVTDLEQFEDIDVRYGGGGEANVKVSSVPASDFVLTGIVRPDAGVVQYSAILTDTRTSAVVWNRSISLAPEAARAAGVLDAVSRSLSLVLGSPRGPLHAAARAFLAKGTPLDGMANLYLCRMLFDLYRETGAPADAKRSGDCLMLLNEADRQSAVSLAIAGSLMAEAVVADESASEEADRMEGAQASLDQAISLSPISGFVWEQHARLRETEGKLGMARTDFGSAIQLNPANTDALAAYARLLALGGRLAEAEVMARDTLDGAPNPPAWYYGVPTLGALHGGDFAVAGQDAEIYAPADRELGPILAILAAQGAGDGAVVNRYLPQVLDVPGFRARGVVPQLRLRITDGALLGQIRTALAKAGVPDGALDGPF